MTEPTLGRIVLYTLSKRDAEEIRQLCDRAASVDRGAVAPVGNDSWAGETFPAIITGVTGPGAPGMVDLRVWLNSTQDHWAASVYEGEGPGTWRWPEATG